MGLKNIAKKVLGDQGIDHIKLVRGFGKLCTDSVTGGKKSMVVDDTWKLTHIYREKGHHLFFGYYDIQQFDRVKEKALITKIPIHADTKKDKADLCWIDVSSGEQHLISQTSAWCWQQGARLRWHPCEEGIVLFNDVEKSQYITRAWDIKSKKEVKRFGRALYDVTSDMRYGFSLNYARLQRLRPGYGYSALPDETITDKAPVDDGLFRVDLETGDIKLMVSLSELSQGAPESIGLWNYLNHISVSPSGKRLIFFHIWTHETTSRWMVALYSINVDGTDLKCLERQYRASHYCWINDDEILITAGGFPNRESRYMVYNLKDGSRRIVNDGLMTCDGHPTLFSDGETFITDTYPLKKSRQKVYISNINENGVHEILSVFSDPRMFGEKRCDLHPRLTPDGKVFSIDTTCNNGTRSVWVFEKS